MEVAVGGSMESETIVKFMSQSSVKWEVVRKFVDAVLARREEHGKSGNNDGGNIIQIKLRRSKI